MTPDEHRLLHDFLDRLRAIRADRKDPDAAAAIDGALRDQPDAAYLLVQRALILEQAVAAAEQRIAALEKERSSRSEPAGGFLDSNAWGRRGSANPAPGVATSVTGAPLAPAARHAASSAAPAQAGRTGGGSFLPTAAAIAAGVVGGAFLSHGIASLLGNPGSAGSAGQPDPLAAAANPGDALFDSRAGSDDLSSGNTNVDDSDFSQADAGFDDDTDFI